MGNAGSFHSTVRLGAAGHNGHRMFALQSKQRGCCAVLVHASPNPLACRA